MLSHTYRPVVPMTPCSLRALFLGQLLPWELKQNMHSKVGGEELLIAWDQLRGQLEVTAS